MYTQFKCKKTVKSRNHSLVLFNPQIGLLSGATTLSQSEPGSDGSKGVLLIPQRSSISGTSSSDCLVSYPGHLLGGGSYPSAEVQSVYYTALALLDKKSFDLRESCHKFHKVSQLGKVHKEKKKTLNQIISGYKFKVTEEDFYLVW